MNFLPDPFYVGRIWESSVFTPFYGTCSRVTRESETLKRTRLSRVGWIANSNSKSGNTWDRPEGGMYLNETVLWTNLPRSMITIRTWLGCFSRHPRFRGNFSYRCQKSSSYSCVYRKTSSKSFKSFFISSTIRSRRITIAAKLVRLYTILLLFRYGRRTILTLTTSLSGISGLIHSFSVNYWMFLAFEFIDATVAAGIYSAGFILGELITRQSKGRCWTWIMPI